MFVPELNAWDLETKEEVQGMDVCPPSTLPASFPTSLRETISPDHGIKIYPNRVGDHLYLEALTPFSEGAQAEILNIEGKIMATKTIGMTTDVNWRVSQLDSGMYIMKISDRKTTYSMKFLKK